MINHKTEKGHARTATHFELSPSNPEPARICLSHLLHLVTSFIFNSFYPFNQNSAGTHYSISLGSQDLQYTQVSGSRDINSSDTDLRACMINSRPIEGLLPRRYSRDNAVFLLTRIYQFVYKSCFRKCVCYIMQKNTFPTYWGTGPPQTFIPSFDITRDKISNSVRTATLSIHLHLICMILVRSI